MAMGGGSERMLCMMWDTNHDRLFFQVKVKRDKYVSDSSEVNGIQEIITKIVILSYINGIYDPLGLMGASTSKDVNAEVMDWG